MVFILEKCCLSKILKMCELHPIRPYICFFLTLIGLLNLKAQTQIAESLSNNVVAISATFEDGHREYGLSFVTGERGQQLYLATAAHVVQNEYSGTSSIEIQFRGEIRRYSAQLLRQDANFDVALLEMTRPNDYRWKQNCLAVPGLGQQVAFIGRERRWFIPPEAVHGAITEIRYNRLMVDIISIRPGTSGAPLVNNQGITRLVIEDQGSTAEVVAIEQVRDILTNSGQFNYVFTLHTAGIDYDLSINDSELERMQQELKDWQAIKNSENATVFRNFFRRYPRGSFSERAIERIEGLEARQAQARELLHWKIIEEKDELKFYKDFVERFPNSNRLGLARRRINELEAYHTIDSSITKEGFIRVEGGPFLMGCTKEQGTDCTINERPAHKVNVGSFAIRKFEVTKKEYVEFLNAKIGQLNIKNDDVSMRGKVIFELSEASKVTFTRGSFNIQNGYERHPVNEVNWYSAIEYCNWLSQKKNGRRPYYQINGSDVSFHALANGYRLPSEAEWEYAARGGY